MKFTKLEDALGRLNHLRAELKAVYDQAGPEYDMDKVTIISGDSQAKVEWIRAKNDEIAEAKAKVDELKLIKRAADVANEEPESLEAGTEPGTSPSRPHKSFGRLFVESRAYKGFQGGTGPAALLEVPDINATLFEKTAGWSPESTRTGVVTLLPSRPARHVVNYIPILPTKQGAVKYMEETTATNNAAEAAEGAAYGEAALVLTERSKTVEKVAVFLPATDEQLEDEEEAAAYVDQRLRTFVEQRLDSQVLVGNGTTPNILGTENVSGIQTQALGGDTTLDALYKAMVLIREDGFAEPDVVFIRASKWQTVRLAKTVDGIYIWGSPSEPGPDTAWGIPVVQTTAVTSTKAILGDYTTHAALYIKRGVEVQVSNSHSDYFAKGKQAIRADLRCAMVHYRPKAFAAVTGL